MLLENMGEMDKRLEITAKVITKDDKQLGSWVTAVVLNEDAIIGERAHDEQTLELMVYPFLEKIWGAMKIKDPHISQMEALRKIREAKSQNEQDAAWEKYDSASDGDSR
jgi:hypothetical protein